MSIIVSNIRTGIDNSDEQAFYTAKKRLKLKDSDIKNMYIYKKSLDARHKNKISFVMSVGVDLVKNESETVNAVSDNFVKIKSNHIGIDIIPGKKKLNNPITIIGFGPAGIFCGYLLAKNGYHPIIFERGASLDERVLKVETFWKQGILDEKTNVQFGEGGAGTFSDGKLVTRISDPLCDFVLNEFVKHGAPKEILYNAKPHIGTDVLRDVISSMRREIIKNGGKIYFNSQFENVNIKNGQVYSIRVNNEDIRTDNVVLALGHSARDTFKMLNNNVEMVSKDFSVGVRIEQLQSTINKGLYGGYACDPRLPKGEYQLSYRKDGRAVYTFCMCPGGLVVPSASSKGTVVTNGMSYHARDGINANSALVVSVGKNDFGNSVLSGIEFQQSLEEKAYKLAGENYKAPAMTIDDFLNGTNKFKTGNIKPSYALGVTPVDFYSLFPSFITDYLKIGLERFDKQLPGFSQKDGILTGVETRTSSPVRILRDENFESVNVKGLYPCGEGAGYAGGITSAAVDGLKVAQKIISTYKIR